MILNNNLEDFEITKLIFLKLNGNVEDSESKKLEDWIRLSKHNLDLYNKICNDIKNGSYNNEILNYNKTKAWTAFNKKKNHFQKSSLILRFTRYAAILTLILGIYFFYFNQSKDKRINTASIEQPGSDKATLKLSDGRTINLDNKDKGEILSYENFKIKNINKELIYIPIPDKKECENFKTKMQYNEINVPQKGEYQVTLSDGTIILLNSISKLKYPVKFLGDKRIVELEGEAYFKVAKNENKPFIVKTKNYSVKVLGTVFNVNAYLDETQSSVTLVNGSVKIMTNNNQSLLLKPGEQMVSENSQINKKEVNIKLFTSWIDSKFLFDNTSLEEIAKQLSRWYGVKIFFGNESVKTMHFTGGINKNRNLTDFMTMLEESGETTHTLNGDCLTIYKK